MKEKILQSLSSIQATRMFYDRLLIRDGISLTTYRGLIEELNRAEEVRFKLLLDLEKQSLEVEKLSGR